MLPRKPLSFVSFRTNVAHIDQTEVASISCLFIYFQMFVLVFLSIFLKLFTTYLTINFAD